MRVTSINKFVKPLASTIHIGVGSRDSFKKMESIYYNNNLIAPNLGLNGEGNFYIFYITFMLYLIYL